jgi:hypothetical protein
VSRRLHRGAVAAAFALAVGAGVTGCGAGFQAESYRVDPDNAEASVGGLLIRNLVMVKAEDAEVAGISGTFVNRGSTADVLERIQVAPGQDAAGGQGGTISISPALEVPANSAVTVGAGESPPLTVPDAAELQVGTFVTMTLTFRQAGPVELAVPLEDAHDYYASIAPTPTPAATMQSPAATPGATTPGAAETPPGEPTPGATTPLLTPGASPAPS